MKRKEFYKPCFICGSKEINPYSRFELINDKLKKINSYLYCERCRTVSFNTAKGFTWKNVVDDWNNRERNE